MEGGDISNAVAPRFVFVFEGLLAMLGDPMAVAQEKLYVRLRRWKKAAACWEVDPVVQRHMWDLVWRHDFGLDVITYKPPAYAEAIEEHLDRHNMPAARVLSTSPEQFAQRLAYMPYVKRVFYREPSRRFIYGDRGVLVEGTFDPWM